VLASVDTPPKDAFFVGDSNVDMQTAKNALCTAIGVTWGFRGRDELAANGADHIVDSPEDLLAIIESR
jgi:phosphoglycolate phosphatase